MAQPVSAEHLALAASLVRAFPRLGCTLRLPCGRVVTVAEHPAHEPQLSPDSLARLLRLERERPMETFGLRWLRAVTDVHLVGSGLSEQEGGLLRVAGPTGEQLAFATLLDVERARVVLEAAGSDDDRLEEVPDDVVVSLRVDPILGCVVVSTAAGGGGDPACGCGRREALIEAAMSAALAACMVEELIAGPAAPRLPG